MKKNITKSDTEINKYSLIFFVVCFILLLTAGLYFLYIWSKFDHGIKPDSFYDLSEISSDSFTEINSENYFYSKLNDRDRLLYDAIADMANHIDNTNYRVGLRIPEEAYKDYHNYHDYIFLARQAFYFDHPEYVCVQNNIKVRLYLNGLDYFKEKHLKIYLYFVNADDCAEKLKEYDKAADELLKNVDMNGSEYDIALQIHDLIINRAEFPERYSGVTLENQPEKTDSWCFNVEGILLGDPSGKYEATCDAYSMTYCYLLKKCGIQALPVIGIIGKDYLPHKWCIAKLDDRWSETDLTVDDKEFIDYYPPETVYPGYEDKYEKIKNDTDYRYKLRHICWDKTTEEMFSDKHEDLAYDGRQWERICRAQYHERLTPDILNEWGQDDIARLKLTALLPKAETKRQLPAAADIRGGDDA